MGKCLMLMMAVTFIAGAFAEHRRSSSAVQVGQTNEIDQMFSEANTDLFQQMFEEVDTEGLQRMWITKKKCPTVMSARRVPVKTAASVCSCAAGISGSDEHI